MDKPSETIYSSGDHDKEQCKPVYLPGTSLPIPDLKPMYYYEALHKMGYVVDGMSLGVYMFEALKMMREIFRKLNHPFRIIPLHLADPDIYTSWNYAINRIGYNRLKDINLKKRYIVVTRVAYKSDTVKLYENGQSVSGKQPYDLSYIPN